MLPLIFRGEVEINQAVDTPPYGVMVAAFAFAIVRITGAYGTWQNQRWGIVLTLIANVIDGLFSAPGIFFAPTTALRLGSAIGVVKDMVIIVLCL